MGLKVVLTFVETRPHWAIQRGLDKEAERLGMRDIVITGDFDEKIAQISGTVEDFAQFARAVQGSLLREGSLGLVAA